MNQAKKLRDDEGPDQGEEGRGAADFDAILEEAKSGNKARDQDFTTLAVPSDIAVNQVFASKNPLCREQMQAGSSTEQNQTSIKDKGKTLCALPKIEEQKLHQTLFNVANSMKKPKV